MTEARLREAAQTARAWPFEEARRLVARFEKAHADIASAKQGLEDSRKELEDVAPDEAWSMGAPGLPVQASQSETSIDFRLRQQIRRQREELERAEHRLQELDVEANLAGVPADWRGAEAAASEAAGSETSAR